MSHWSLSGRVQVKVHRAETRFSQKKKEEIKANLAVFMMG